MKNSEKQPGAPEKSSEEKDDVVEETMSGRKTISKNNSKRAASRELRRKQREELRLKSVGVGISIPSSFSADDFSSKSLRKSNKIIFDESEGEEVQVEEKEIDETEHPADVEKSDDDDDVVEQMESSVARSMALQQREQERMTAKMAVALQSRPRKKKTSKTGTDDNDGDDEQFDKDFFAQVDSEITEKRKLEKAEKKGHNNAAGRHTTFLTSEDDVAANLADSPIEVNQNVELVVIGETASGVEYPPRAGQDRMDLACEAQMNRNPPSDNALIYSRSQLIVNGSYHPSAKEKKKAKKARNNNVLSSCEGWKRSKKMNRLLLSKARSSRMTGKGVPASQFRVHT